MTIFGGIDLHSNNSVISLIDTQDHVISEKRLPNELSLPRAWCHRPERHLGQGELMRSIKRGCPGVRCHFSLGRIPDQQQPTSKEARETACHERLRALVQD